MRFRMPVTAFQAPCLAPLNEAGAYLSVRVVQCLAVFTIGRRQHASPETLEKHQCNDDKERESWDAMVAHGPASSSFEFTAFACVASLVNFSSPIMPECPFRNSD